MYKKILVSLALFSSVSFAGLIDAIAITVNNDPITLVDLSKIKEQNRVDNQQAKKLAIKLKLQEQEVKKRGIEVLDIEVTDQLKKIADSNKLSVMQLLGQVSSQQGLTTEQFKKLLKQQIQQQKLFQSIYFEKSKSNISDEELKEYYNLHINEFIYHDSFDVIEYKSLDVKALQSLIQNPLIFNQNIIQKNHTLKHNMLSKKLVDMFTSMENGSFSQIIPVQNQYVLFYLQKKSALKIPKFEEIAKDLEKRVIESKRETILTNYFEDIESKAKIRYLRD